MPFNKGRAVRTEIPGEETMEHAPTLDPERGTSRKLNFQSTDSKEELASPGIAAVRIKEAIRNTNSEQ